eukprot:UN03950
MFIHSESFMVRHSDGIIVKDYVESQELLHDFSMMESLYKPLSKLSTGELKKVEIINLLYLKPKLIIFDEVFNGIDIDSLDHVFSILDVYAQKYGIQYIFITHLENHHPPFVEHKLNMKEKYQYSTEKLIKICINR